MFAVLDEKSPILRKRQRRRKPPRHRQRSFSAAPAVRVAGKDGEDDKAGQLDTSRNSQQSSSVSSLKRHLQHPFSSPKKDEENKENDVVITEDTVGLSRQGSLASSNASNADNLAGGERGVDVGRVGAWATDFEKLLGDPVGLQTFAEFLKKEFSAENILFWVSCERFRRLAVQQPSPDPQLLHSSAIAILDRHLAQGAPDPVNVDSHARQAAQDGMAAPSASLFAAAQKQIYNLMKFDSFSRFLKSDLYKESLLAEMAGKPLPYSDSLDPEVMLEEVEKSDKAVAKKKKDEDTGNRRRSLLPWTKDRSKSKERQKNSKTAMQRDDSRSSIHGVEDATNNLDGKSNGVSENCTLARVILPDKATTVVQTRPGETIRAMVARLLEKRGLRLTSFDVFATAATAEGSSSLPDQSRPLDLSADCSTLNCTEVRVEPRVLFRLELPSGKSVGVKAKPAKVVRDVLGPILRQYGWELDNVQVRREGAGGGGRATLGVDLDSTVASIDNSRLAVSENANVVNGVSSSNFRGRARSVNNVDDARSLASNSSTGSLGERRRQTSATDDEKLAMPPPSRIPQIRSSSAVAAAAKTSLSKAPIVTEELYEGLKIAQRGRLEDQRGTEINFEMPDFLKRSQDKENFPYSQQSPAPHRQSEPIIPLHFQQQQHHLPAPPNYERLSYQSNQATPQHYYSQIQEHEYQQPYALNQQEQQHRRGSFFLRHGGNESTFSHDGFLPSSQEAERLFVGNQSDASGYFNESRLSLGFNPRQVTPVRGGRVLPQTPSDAPMYETLTHYKSWGDQQQQQMLVHQNQFKREPPPLPPKPRMSTSSMPASFSGRPSVGSEADLPMPPNFVGYQQQQQHHQQQQQQRPSQPKGYNVSFV